VLCGKTAERCSAPPAPASWRCRGQLRPSSLRSHGTHRKQQHRQQQWWQSLCRDLFSM
jgi:hypothetical protein